MNAKYVGRQVRLVNRFGQDAQVGFVHAEGRGDDGRTEGLGASIRQGAHDRVNVVEREARRREIYAPVTVDLEID